MSDKIITPPAILSYPFLFEPRASKTIDKETGKPMMKYSASLIFLPGTDLKALKQAYIAAVHEKFGVDKGNDLIKREVLKNPFRKDWAKKGYPENSEFINVTAKKKPGIVSIYRDPATGKPMKITDPEQVYPGCLVIASLRLFWYDVDGNKGFSFGLNNIQVRSNDKSKYPSLDGRMAAEDEFEADEDAPADFDGDGASSGGSAADADLSDLV